MSRHAEVMSNSVLLVFGFDVVKMVLEAVHYTSLCLTYILHVAYFAGDTVYEITAFTVNPDFARVFSISDCTCDSARSV